MNTIQFLLSQPCPNSFHNNMAFLVSRKQSVAAGYLYGKIALAAGARSGVGRITALELAAC